MNKWRQGRGKHRAPASYTPGRGGGCLWIRDAPAVLLLLVLLLLLLQRLRI